MSGIGLSGSELSMIRKVLADFSWLQKAILFGSRAKGVSSVFSDVDIALSGCPDSLEAERVGFMLNELPLPYKFDVQAVEFMKSQALLEHIERVGIVLYESGSKF